MRFYEDDERADDPNPPRETPIDLPLEKEGL